MLIIEIAALENGAHNNQTINGSLSRIPEGWAVVPDTIEVPDTFPFVDIEVEGQTVVSMTAGVVPEPEEDVSAQIAELKEQLAATDYKIIKCSEYQLAGMELPYDIQALHEERQALRDAINELESAQ